MMISTSRCPSLADAPSSIQWVDKYVKELYQIWDSETAELIKPDLNQHPTKTSKPNQPYCHTFDIYFLGILLLQIGLSVSRTES